MEHTKPDHPEIIRSIGLSTGWDQGAEWEIATYEGQKYYYCYSIPINTIGWQALIYPSPGFTQTPYTPPTTPDIRTTPPPGPPPHIWLQLHSLNPLTIYSRMVILIDVPLFQNTPKFSNPG